MHKVLFGAKVVKRGCNIKILIDKNARHIKKNFDFYIGI